MTTRGIRTNNPGNLRASIPWWNGQTGVDEHGMCIFATPEAGFRALALTIKAYQTKHGCKTLRDIFERYAPPDPEGDNNDTAAYVADVAKRVGVAPDQPFEFFKDLDAMQDLLEAICFHENGSQPWALGILAGGVRGAFA